MFNRFGNSFREQAIAASENRQQLDRLLRVTAPHERIVLAATGLLLASLGVWALFGSIDREITLQGVLLEPGQRYEVVATEPGYLVEYLVEPGDRVEPGSGIARMRVPAPAGEAGVALPGPEQQRPESEAIASQMGGEVTVLRATLGDYLSAGTAVAQLREPVDRPLQAAVRASPRVAQRLRPGMPATVEVQLPGGETRRLDGTVSAVMGPSPVWLSDWPPAEAEAAPRIDIDLEPVPGMAFGDGTPCRVRISLGRYSLAALLGLRSV
ncbi:MAG: HlyD family efflux transporter periplasmic adaptor subunit [Gemmatimonadota bacterium]|nr:HlyD family efflux transporter periplasmic adaptor subunit [Gemmatimonadota bacterium]